MHGVDVRYAATYGNPHLRTGGGLGFPTVNTAKPASTPAPPPYSSVRSSVILPSGKFLLYLLFSLLLSIIQFNSILNTIIQFNIELLLLCSMYHRMSPLCFSFFFFLWK